MLVSEKGGLQNILLQLVHNIWHTFFIFPFKIGIKTEKHTFSLILNLHIMEVKS